MPMKIFELAKELEMGALDLVEELKSKGFPVRNHMNALSDEDVEKVRELYKPKPAAKKKSKKKKTTKKKSKKKVAKKTAKKKTAKAESAEEAQAPEEEAEEAAPKKKTTRRKKTVIRKKAPSAEAKAKEDAEAKAEAETEAKKEQAEAPQVEAKKEAEAPEEKAPVEKPKAEEETEEKTSERVEAKSEADQAKAPEKEKSEFSKTGMPTGLRVVSAPEKKIAPEEEAIEEGVEDDPKKSAVDKNVEAEPEVVEEGDEEDRKKADSSKKRLGGLASMMSGKKAPKSKSQALQESRAESEMKSYAALSSLGHPIYTQAKRKRNYTGPAKDTEITEVKDSKRFINLEGGSTVSNLAHVLKVKVEDLIDEALDLNLLLKPDDYLGIKLASQVADLYDFRVEDVSFKEEEVLGGDEDLAEKEKDKLPLRDPIITIMGHVDHGKTTLLDYVRKAKVVEGEAGGITQHIGAYSVKAKGGKTLTFLDTPGHAAFASMRQRGADVTDVVVLVVAADDGVMPQTRESIKFCQNAGKPVIVAVNKMDKEDANPDRVKSELAEMDINPEEWGGDVQFVPISALKGDGVEDLLESIALQSEILELRADPKGNAEGVVIESFVEQGRGPVTTILVQKGTLKKGDSIVVGETYGRARSLTDHTGKQLEEAGPSVPVQILGLKEAPQPGDTMHSVKNERKAKKVAENRASERLALESTPEKKKVSLEDFFAQAESGEQKTLNVIVRADVQGSYEAIKQALEPLGNAEVSVKVLGGGVGPISDSDVQLAESAEAIIFGFNMRPMTSARKKAEQKGVDIRTYSVIYELISDVTLALEGMLEPEFKEKYIGRAEVKETFNVPKVGTIAGSQVIDGSIQVGADIRLLREGKIVYDGKISSLKRFKDDVKEVKSGYECGVGLQNFNDIKIGDVFEAYVMEEQKRTLDTPTNKETGEESTSSSSMTT